MVRYTFVQFLLPIFIVLIVSGCSGNTGSVPEFGGLIADEDDYSGGFKDNWTVPPLMDSRNTW
jgi:hypothetical protein